MTKKVKFMARMSGVLCGTLLAVVIAIPIMYIAYNLNVISEPVQTNSTPKIVTNTEVDTNSLKGYTNIAIFGLDSRQNNYGTGNRSDTIMIASINNDTKEIKLVSVYRDTYLEIPNHGLDKMTHAYAYGGAELAINTLNRNLDLNITDYVSINWFAAAKAVDILGGLNVEVKPYELNELNRVITMTNKSFSKKSSLLTTSGKQKLDGIQAVSYARIRKVGNNDFERTERQRVILEAAFKKAKKANFTKIISLINSLSTEIATNMSVTDILALAKPAMKYSVKETTGFPDSKYSQKINGADFVLSSNLPEDVSTLHKFLFDKTDYTASSVIRQIQSQISYKVSISKTENTTTSTDTSQQTNNNTSNNNTGNKSTSSKDSSNTKDTTNKDTTNKDTTNKDTTNKDTANKDKDKGKDTGQEDKTDDNTDDNTNESNDDTDNTDPDPEENTPDLDSPSESPAVTRQR